VTFDPSLVAKGLAARLADIEAARQRYASFAFVPDGRPLPGGVSDTDAAARELVLRALHVLADPVNERLVRALADGDATVAALGALVALPDVATWERVNDLVQVGLARHAVDGDRVGLTGAGLALAELVAELTRRIAGEHDAC
jgi:hypothetical protein